MYLYANYCWTLADYQGIWTKIFFSGTLSSYLIMHSFRMMNEVSSYSQTIFLFFYHKVTTEHKGSRFFASGKIKIKYYFSIWNLIDIKAVVQEWTLILILGYFLKGGSGMLGIRKIFYWRTLNRNKISQKKLVWFDICLMLVCQCLPVPCRCSLLRHSGVCPHNNRSLRKHMPAKRLWSWWDGKSDPMPF